MSRRIDVELTSERPDGSWTWRAAGAREPRGELDGTLLPAGSKVGDVLKADADFDIDGVTIISVKQPGGKREISGLLELLPSEREFQPVTSTLVGKRDRGDRGDRGDRRDRPPRDRDRGDRPDRERGPRPDRRDRPPREGGAGGGGDRPPRSERPRRERPPAPPPVPERPKPKKLRPGRAHRDELLASLTPDKRLIAEQLLKGGIPAVRTALDEQNAKARAEGQPEVPTAGVLQVAEDLAPATRIADWLDRADAAVADLEEVSLRDLRAVVTSANDVGREERTKELASTLKEALDRRTAAELEQWIGDVKLSLGAGRVVRALRLASRPPMEGQALPAELLTELAAAGSAALTADVLPDRWATLLDAVAYSPVRRDVVAAGIPAEPGEELLAAVRKHAGRTPQLATLFGVEPPPSATKPARKPRPPKPKPIKAVDEQLAHAAGAPVVVDGRRIPPPPKPVAAAPAGAGEQEAAPEEPSAEPQPSPALGEEGAPSATESLPDAAPATPPAASAEPQPSPALGEEGAPSATDSLPDDAPATPPAASAEPIEVPAEPAAAPDEVGEDAAEGAAAEANDEPVPEAAPDPQAPSSDTAPGTDEGADTA